MMGKDAVVMVMVDGEPMNQITFYTEPGASVRLRNAVIWRRRRQIRSAATARKSRRGWR